MPRAHKTVLQRRRCRMATCAAQSTSQQCSRESHWHFQRPLHYNSLQLRSTVSIALVVPPHPPSHDNAQPPASIKHQSSPFGRSTAQRPHGLQQDTPRATRNKSSGVRKPRETQNMGPTRRRWVVHWQCARALPMPHNLCHQNESRTNSTYRRIFPARYIHATQLIIRQRCRSSKDACGCPPQSRTCLTL